MWWTMIWPLVWPNLASIATAALVWLALRNRPRPHRAEGSRAAIAVGVAVIVMMGFPFVGLLPLWIDASLRTWADVFDLRFALPLVLGLILVAVLAMPRRRHDVPTGAHLAPRTWRSFIASWWLGVCLAVLALIVGLTLATGFASVPDEEGHYTMYIVDFGASAAGSTIYGWHFSVLPLALIALIVAATWWALSTIARPPFGTDLAADAATRRLHSTNVIRVALGALLLHLKSILASLASTSSLTSTTRASDGASFTSGTPFSALTGALQVSATLVGIIGLGLWIYTVLMALPSASRSARSSVAP